MASTFKRPISKIVCIGRNYADHIKELGNKTPQAPFFFLKPPSSILFPQSGPLLIPKGTDCHHEVELALVIGKQLRNLDQNNETEAFDSIDGYALAIDMSARNVQNKAKKEGMPWSIAKGFDTFCPLSAFVPKPKVTDPSNIRLELSVNGKVRQNDLTNLMIFKIPTILSVISSIMTLEPGDIVLTGTPKGVSSIVPGDHVYASMYNDGDNKPLAEIDVYAEEKPGPYIFEG